ncbi:glycolate oxidase subunit GlcF [Methylomonas sp. MgM2]
MQTQLADLIKDTPKGRLADSILRSCVHCGFCNAVCPTYGLLGDELDGPRGRIYLIKQVMEGNRPSQKTQTHLDRCLTCRACETACPSGVRYSRLLDIGRDIVDQSVKRPPLQRLVRKLLLYGLPYPHRFSRLVAIGRKLGFIVPEKLKSKLPRRRTIDRGVDTRHRRRMLMLEGCVQPVLAPGINAATVRVLDQVGISAISMPINGCCGALPYHLNDQATGLNMMRRMIDLCWPEVEKGLEAIVINASGCGVTLKEYGELLLHDPLYADKAVCISALAKDIVEILSAEDLSSIKVKPRRIAFHSPCTLQHGQGIIGLVEQLMTRLGFTLTAVPDAHLCCGSAGAYSILQPDLADRLRTAKMRALQTESPELIATANIGCLLHLKEIADRPVLHWIELLAEVNYAD